MCSVVYDFIHNISLTCSPGSFTQSFTQTFFRACLKPFVSFNCKPTHLVRPSYSLFYCFFGAAFKIACCSPVKQFGGCRRHGHSFCGSTQSCDCGACSTGDEHPCPHFDALRPEDILVLNGSYL